MAWSRVNFIFTLSLVYFETKDCWIVPSLRQTESAAKRIITTNEPLASFLNIGESVKHVLSDETELCNCQAVSTVQRIMTFSIFVLITRRTSLTFLCAVLLYDRLAVLLLYDQRPVWLCCYCMISDLSGCAVIV